VFIGNRISGSRRFSNQKNPQAEVLLQGFKSLKLAFEGAGFISVQIGEASLVRRHFSIHVNGVDRANGLASATLNTLIRVDVELRFAVELINTVYGTNTHASFVFNVNTRFCNNERH
jgi:hypothetical protein